MKQEICWELFKKHISKTISESEQYELQQWRKESLLHQTIYDEILEDRELQKVILSDRWNDPDADWDNFLPFIKRGKSKLFISKRIFYSSAAAIIILFIGIQGGNFFRSLMNRDNPSPESFTYIYSPRGQRTRVILPDKTKVWLNSETSIKYAADFNQTSREVTIEGEAFFEVEKNPKIPFLVYASELKLKVYGTSFNVKAYLDERVIETTLVEGKLSITSLSGESNELGKKELFLNPQSKFTYTKTILDSTITAVNHDSEITNRETLSLPNSNKIKKARTHTPLIQTDESNDEVLWKDGKLIFKEESFETLAVKLERWYDVKIHFTNEKIKKYRFTGIFERETINQAMDALKISSAKSYEYKIVFRDIYLK